MLNIGFMQGRLSDMVNGRIQSFPFSNWKEEFVIAHKNNFNTIEWTIDSINIENNPILNTKMHSEIKSLKQKYSIDIPSVTCDFFMEKPFFKANNQKRISRENFLLDFFKNCSELNITYIVIPLVDNGSIDIETHEKIVLNFFLKNIGIIEKYNLQIIFESNFPPEKLKIFISKFPKKYFGINYDTGNSASLGYNYEEEFDAYFEYIKNVHIKDRILGGTTVPLGEGDTDLSGILIDLLKRNYSRNLILQTARDKNKHLEVLCKYREFVLNIINHYEKK